MKSKEKKADTGDLDERLNREYALGEAHGLHVASNIVAAEAAGYFNQSKDDIARILRSLAKKIQDQSDKIKPAERK